MASLILGGAGAAIGSGIGGSFLGMSATSLGWMIGSTLGNLLFAEKQHVYGPRLKGDRFTGSALGQVRPIVYGTNRVQGKIIWQTPYHEHEHTEDSGGKGGGGTEYTTYTYTRSFAVLLCEGELQAVRRIWINGKLAYDWSENASAAADFESGLQAEGIKIYPGSTTQLPDPTIESFDGAGSVPAYRGSAYIVFNEYDVTDTGGACPVVEAEVVANATLGSTQGLGTAAFGTENFTAIGYINEGIVYLAEETPYYVNPSYGSLYVRIYGVDISTGNKVFSLELPNQIQVPTLPGVSRGPCCDDAYYWYTMGAQYLPEGGQVDEIAVVASAIKTLNGTFLANGWQYLRNTDGTYTQVAQYGGWRDQGTLEKFMFKRGIYQSYLYGTSVSANPDQKRWVQRWDMPSPTASKRYDFADGTYNLCCYPDDAGDVYVSNGGNNTLYRLDYNLNLIESKALPVGVTPVLIAIADGLLWIAEGLGGTTNISGTVTAYDYQDYTVVGTQSIFAADSTSRGFRSFSMRASGNSVVLTVDDFVFTVQVGRAARNSALLSDIVADLHQRSGQTTDDYEVGALTDEVRGYLITEQVSARSCIEQLQIGYLFDAKDSEGKIKYVKRGSYPTEALTEDDLGAFETEPVSDWTVVRQQEEELPQTLSVVYLDFNASYEKAAQNATRQTMLAGDVATFQVPLVFTADEAQSLALKQQMAACIARTKYKWTTNMQWAKLEPCDVVTVKGQTIRITSRTDGVNGIIEFEGVAELPEIYTNVGVGSLPSGYEETTIQVRGPTMFEVMDLPPLRDGDYNTYTQYLAATGVLDGWPSAAIMRSDNGDNYSLVSVIASSSVMGYATSVLGTWTGGNVPDEKNSVTVQLYGSGTLSSVTFDEFINGDFPFLLGNELIFGRTATLVSTGVYTITGLLRGRIGTEAYMSTHAANDRFVLLSESNLRKMTPRDNDFNVERYYKGVTSQNKISNAMAKVYTYVGNNLKPLSPCSIGGGTAGPSTSWTIRWMRRTRFRGQWLDYYDAGEDETTYNFEVRIYNNPDTPTTVIRTLTVSNATASGGFFSTTYSIANQLTDFGAGQKRIAVSVRQIGSFVNGAWSDIVVLRNGYATNSVLLLHMNGTNASTSFPDVYGHTVTANGNAQVSTAQYKFGGASGLFDGTGDYLNCGDSADFEFGSGDFTLEAQIYLTGYSNGFGGAYSCVIIGKDASGARGFHWRVTGTSSSWTLMEFVNSAGTVTQVSWSPSLNTWYHVAVSRSGNNMRFFVDGVQIGSTQTFSSTLADVSTALTVGGILFTSFEYYFKGYIDELRVTKGEALYTSNFAPPTAEFDS
jgi:hypothetical protein